MASSVPVSVYVGCMVTLYGDAGFFVLALMALMVLTMSVGFVRFKFESWYTCTTVSVVPGGCKMPGTIGVALAWTIGVDVAVGTGGR